MGEVNSEKLILVSFKIEWNMIILHILRFPETKRNSVWSQKQKDNCQHDYISFNLEAILNLFLLVCGKSGLRIVR